MGKGKYCNESKESTLFTTDNMLQINAILDEGDGIVSLNSLILYTVYCIRYNIHYNLYI